MQQFSVVYEGKKKLFKLASSNTIQQVAVQVAADFGIDGINSITLRHKKTILDPSLPLRFANVPSNAELTIEVKNSSNSLVAGDISGGVSSSTVSEKVKLAISVEGINGSMSETFGANDTILNVIEKLIISGHIIDRDPHTAEVIFIRQKFTGSQLGLTTLASLGLSGIGGRFLVRFPVTGGAATEVTHKESPTTSPLARIESTASYAKDDTPLVSPVKTSTDTLIDLEELRICIQEAVTNVLHSNFDVANKSAIILIMKYIVNIQGNPSEQKFRTIKMSNKSFVEKILAVKGGVDLMSSIGFLCVKTEVLLQRSEQQFDALNFASRSQESDILTVAFSVLSHAADELDIAAEDRPTLPSRGSLVPVSVPANLDFDPYKSHVHRSNPQPSRPVTSVTEQRLELLEAKRRELEGNIESVARNTEILMPLADGTVIDVVSLSVDDEGKEDDSGPVSRDSNMLMKSLAKKMSQGPADEVPLTTRALRELERAKKERVYSKTLIRVRFPDKIFLQGYFHPRDNVASIYNWVNDCLRSSSPGDFSFELSISPPLRVLQPPTKRVVQNKHKQSVVETLLDLQLIPAAVINLRWKEVQTGSGLGWYLVDELLSQADSRAKKIDRSVAYPVGEQLLAAGGGSSSEVPSRELADAVADGKEGGVKGTTPKLFSKLFGKK